jgi:formylglycine-generating enzyme required for sulfatase activity
MRPAPDPRLWILAGVALVGAGCGASSAPDASPRARTVCPAHMVHLPAVPGTAAVCMDRYEFPNRAHVLPRTHVTWDEAAEICASQGKRLCTSAEWTRACSGPPVNGVKPRPYAYGTELDPKRCNTPRNDPGPLPGQPAPLAESGSFLECHSVEGIFDLNGNVSEWVSDGWTEAHGPLMRSKDQPDARGAPRVVRGGTMWSQTPYGQSCASSHGHAGESRFNDDGFRCCAGPR